MLCVIPFYSGDKHLAINLAKWIEQLGGVSQHDCLLIVDKSTDSKGVIEPLHRAFKSITETLSEPTGDQGQWGNGTTNAEAPNEMWITASAYIYHKFNCRWFWLETDAVPMRLTWLDEIESEDKRGRKPFMGAYVNIPPHEPHMSGIAVYPPNVPDHSLKMATPGVIAWDYAGRGDTVGKGKAHFTTLIQHEYRIHGEPPNFPTQESLNVIKPGTAVFHRCKNDSLIARLREKFAATSAGSRRLTESASPVEPSLEVAAITKENIALKQKVEELTEKLNTLRIAPALAAATHGSITPELSYPKELPKKGKRTMSPEHKAKIQAALAKARQAKKDKAL